MIRTLTIADSLPCISFCRKEPFNEIPNISSTRAKDIGLPDILKCSLFRNGNGYSWLYFSDGQIEGLINVHTKSGADIWEIDKLYWLPAEQKLTVLTDLLSKVVDAAYSEGIHQTLLRINSTSQAEAPAKQCGFIRYATEQIFILENKIKQFSPDQLNFRPRSQTDHISIFRLYCASVPVTVRQIEGMTIQEWRSKDGWRLYNGRFRNPSAKKRYDYVLETAHDVSVWLQVDTQTNSLTILSHNALNVTSAQILQSIINFADPKRPILIIARDYQEPWLTFLEQNYALLAEHALLSRTLSVRVLRPGLVPVRVRVP